MRQIVIDELNHEERDSIESYLKRNLTEGEVAGIFWLSLPEHLLSGAQLAHRDCSPFVFGIELTDKKLQGELLVRSSRNLHCSCISYASKKQREFLLDFLDRMLEEEGITS
ncbi:MAG: hypothetical protein ACQES8_02785 [Thermodesulfobacteriota bacterium]